MTLQEFLSSPPPEGGVRKPVALGDGTVVSIQAGSYHYCRPRTAEAGTTYTHVEVGLEGPLIEAWADLVEAGGDDTLRVYPYVPVELLEEFVQSRGGLPA
jgi:hypothetical protein